MCIRDSDGIDFAIVRLGNRGYTEGALYADEQAAANLDGAAAAGLETGAYFFSQATTEDEAREEDVYKRQVIHRSSRVASASLYAPPRSL